jgi:molybdate transport system substrate-binding protein
VRAADVTFLCAVALKPVMDELIPQFQRESGHKVTVAYATIGANTERVEKGDPADLAVVNPQQFEQLRKTEKVLDGTVFAKVGLGVFVKKGAPKPDISTVEAFKRAFTNAKAVSVPVGRGSPVAAFAEPLFERLGMTAMIKAKNKAIDGRYLEFVANGEADIGLSQMTVTLATAGVDSAGPLPKDIQYYTVYTAAIPKHAKEAEAARAFVQFLTSPKAAAALKTRGLEQD